MTPAAIRRILNVAPDAAYWTVVVLLLLMSVGFTWNVQTRRGAWNTDRTATELQSGTAVRVVQVIDGDEVSVRHAGGTVVVRLLGIKAFDPKVQEPGVSAAGQACLAALERMTLSVDVEARVEFAESKMDKSGRLLAYLHVGERDVGRTLLEQGHAIVYNRYPFSREEAYESAEAVARTRNAGLWANPKAAVRAEALRATWEAQRKDG